jgi:hypothetical protein
MIRWRIASWVALLALVGVAGVAYGGASPVDLPERTRPPVEPPKPKPFPPEPPEADRPPVELPQPTATLPESPRRNRSGDTLPTETVTAVRAPEHQRARVRKGLRLRAIPLRTLDPEELARAREEAGGQPAAGPESEGGPRAAVFSGLNEPGLAATDNADRNQGSPPDATGAIGPKHYVEFVNIKVAVYDRSTLASPPVSKADLDTFVGAKEDLVFDPQIQWDPLAEHWFYLAARIDGDNRAFLAFGWSKTSSPTSLDSSGWCRFFVSSGDNGLGGTYFDDYPKLGHDKKHVIFGTNVFQDPDLSAFVTARIWAFNKPRRYSSCKPPKLVFAGNPDDSSEFLQTKDGDDVFTPVPANHSDSTRKGYVVAADFPDSTADEIAVFRVKGTSPITISSRGNIAVSSYTFPDLVPQPFPGQPLDSLDARLTQAVGHADPQAGDQQAVWTQHTIDGPGGRSVARWYELLPGQCDGSVSCLGLRQEGTVANDTHYVFNAAISPSRNGDQAVINYNVGSEELAAEIRAQSRVASTQSGAMGGEVTLASSDGNIDQDFTCNPVFGCRWGDYAGASPDPKNSSVVWGSNQYNGEPSDLADMNPRWLTRNFALTP